MSEIVDRGALEAAAAVDLDRVVLSRVDDGALVAEAVHWRDDPGMARDDARRCCARARCGSTTR